MKNYKLKDYIPFEELEKELLADPEVRAIVDELQPEYDLICQMIDKRLEKKMRQKEENNCDEH